MPRQRDSSLDQGDIVELANDLVLPGIDGLVLDSDSRGVAQVAVGTRQVGPGGPDGRGVLLAVILLELLALGPELRRLRRCLRDAALCLLYTSPSPRD